MNHIDISRCIVCLEEDAIETINSCGCKVTLHSTCNDTMQSYGLLCPICRTKKNVTHDVQHDVSHDNMVEYLFMRYPNYLTFLLFIIFCFAFTILYIVPKIAIEYMVKKIKIAYTHYDIFSNSSITRLSSD